ERPRGADLGKTVARLDQCLGEGVGILILDDGDDEFHRRVPPPAPVAQNRREGRGHYSAQSRPTLARRSCTQHSRNRTGTSQPECGQSLPDQRPVASSSPSADRISSTIPRCSAGLATVALVSLTSNGSPVRLVMRAPASIAIRQEAVLSHGITGRSQ